MKYSVLLILTMIAITCHAQRIEIVLVKGDTIKTKLQATSEFYLLTESGNYQMRDIANLIFDKKTPRTEQIAQELGSKIKVSYRDMGVEEIPTPILIIKDQPQINASMSMSIENFRKQRATGKGLQLLGAVIVGASIGVQAMYNKQYATDYDNYIKKGGGGTAPTQKFVSSAVPVIGTGISVIGFAVDWDAGKHLKLFGK